MKNLLIVCICCLLLPISFGGHTATRINIFSDSQLVVDQSAAVRQKAMRSALSRVLVKVTGKSEVLNQPDIKAALARPLDYLIQYGYESTDETLILAGSTRPASRLILQFSPEAINQLMTQAAFPVLSSSRPDILLWLVTGDQQKRFLGADSPEVTAIKQAGTQVGLPLFSPQLDLTDRGALSASRVWLMDEELIRNASQRYSPDAILAGRLIPVASGSSWQGHSILIYKDQPVFFSNTDASPEQVASNIIRQVARYFASQDAVIVNDKSSAPTIDIVVNDITDFATYVDLLAVLDELPLVAAHTVKQIDGTQMVVTLRYNGSPEKIIESLAGSNRLEPAPLGLDNNIDITIFSWR